MLKVISCITFGLFIGFSSGATKPDPTKLDPTTPYPMTPDPELTPGELCKTPSQLRYPEKIKFCKRSVKSSLKYKIIETYDEERGFEVAQMNRRDFKIDHYIPLCAGGSNDESNLWPQHVSVYEITDPLEPLICKKMSEGKLLQKDAVDLIHAAKTNLELVDQIIEELHRL